MLLLNNLCSQSHIQSHMLCSFLTICAQRLTFSSKGCSNCVAHKSFRFDAPRVAPRVAPDVVSADRHLDRPKNVSEEWVEKTLQSLSICVTVSFFFLRVDRLVAGEPAKIRLRTQPPRACPQSITRNIVLTISHSVSHVVLILNDLCSQSYLQYHMLCSQQFVLTVSHSLSHVVLILNNFCSQSHIQSHMLCSSLAC